jgi:hypothetical protein
VTACFHGAEPKLCRVATCPHFAAPGSVHAGPACVHGAPPKLCAFAGCAHYVPNGPRDERWAFAPGTSPADIEAALVENRANHARAPGSASPIHLVVARKTRERLGIVANVAAGDVSPPAYPKIDPPTPTPEG